MSGAPLAAGDAGDGLGPGRCWPELVSQALADAVWIVQALPYDASSFSFVKVLLEAARQELEREDAAILRTLLDGDRALREDVPPPWDDPLA